MVKERLRRHRFLIKDWEWDTEHEGWFSEGTVINMDSGGGNIVSPLDYASLYTHLTNPCREIYLTPTQSLESITVNLTMDSWGGLNDI
jgi:hypothetical protein